MLLYYIFLVKLLIVQCVEATMNKKLIITKELQISQIIVKLLECGIDKYGNSVNVYFIEESKHYSIALHSIFASYTSMYLFKSERNNVLENYPRFQKVHSINETHVERLVYPVSNTIVVASDTMSFLDLLRKMKNSIWWNHAAYFFIVNLNLGNSCQMARVFLSIAWSFNILLAVYLCRSWDDQILLYTFNPYTNLASELWSEIKTNVSSNTPWTLFYADTEKIYLALKSGKKVCRGYIFFDKTKNLNGFNLKAAIYISQVSYRYNPAKKGFDRMDGVGFNIMSTILIHINATINTKASSVLNSLKDVLSGIVDFAMFISYMRDVWKQQAQTFYADSLKIVTRKKVINFSERFFKTFTTKLWIFLFLSTFVCIVTLKYILKQKVSEAALEFIRLFTNNTSLAKPLTTTARILFILCVSIVFTFSTFVQSCLSAINTASGTSSAVDSSDDLIKSGLPIYGLSSCKEIVMQKEIRERFIGIPSPKDCFDRILNGDDIACLYPNFTIWYNIYESDIMHISKGNVFERTHTYTCAEDLPLLQTFNSLLLMMNEGGITKRYFDIQSVHFKKPETNDKIVTLKSDDLTLMFGILAIGWISGIFLLFAELISRIVKIRIRFTFLSCWKSIVRLLARIENKFCKKH